MQLCGSLNETYILIWYVNTQAAETVIQPMWKCVDKVTKSSEFKKFEIQIVNASMAATIPVQDSTKDAVTPEVCMHVCM